MIGYKHLRADGSSLNGKIKYALPVDGKPGPWQNVPGNGSYLAVTGGLFSAKDDPQGILVRMEGDKRKAGPLSGVQGVVCNRRVRVLAVMFRAGDSLPALTAAFDLGAQAWLAKRLPVEQLPALTAAFSSGAQELLAERLPVKQLPALTAAFSPDAQWWLAERLPAEQLPALTAAFSPDAQALLAKRLPVEQLPALTAAFSPDAQAWLAKRLPELRKPQEAAKAAGGEG